MEAVAASCHDGILELQDHVVAKTGRVREIARRSTDGSD